MITADGLTWSFGDRAVLHGVSLATRPGRVLGLVGPNGSGKTTLLRLLHGALSGSGTVRLDDAPLASWSTREVARRVAVVVQETGGESLLSVAETVLLGRGPHLSTFQRTGAEDHRVAAVALRRVGAAHLAARPFSALSGGERQRVLIARALTQQATHLLLDEPTNHLDIRYQHEVLSLVASLSRTGDHSAVVVLHDLNLAARYCDDVVLLGDGDVVARGTVSDVLRPEILEPVYEIGVRRLELDGQLHLLFHPLPPGDARENPSPTRPDAATDTETDIDTVRTSA